MSEAIYTDGTYAAHNPTMGTEGSPRKAAEVVDALHRNRVAPRSICEIGCGAGAILETVSATFPDADCVGYEIQPEAVEWAQSRTTDRLRFELRDITAVDERFDVALYLDVIEHVDDLYGFLRSAKSIADTHVFRIPLDLCVQGLLLVKGMERAHRKLGHIHSFSRHTALWSLEDAGFTVKDWRYLQPMPLFKGQSVAQKAATWPRRAAFRVAPETTVRTLGGFSLQVIAS